VNEAIEVAKSPASLISDLQREYVRKSIVLVGLMLFVLWEIYNGSEYTQVPIVIMFSLLVDTLGIKRSQRICRLFDKQGREA
jgi:hypothetical protein